jgi:hypothetical protein
LKARAFERRRLEADKNYTLSPTFLCGGEGKGEGVLSSTLTPALSRKRAREIRFVSFGDFAKSTLPGWREVFSPMEMLKFSKR